MKLASVILIFMTSVVSSLAQEHTDSVKIYTTTRLTGDAPKIDGLQDDPAWDLVPWGGGDFRQHNPDPGAPASVQTKFKILYDDKNLYVIILNLDPDPSKIVSRMSRRDGFEGDFVEINIDSYHDKRTAFSFTASVSGVKGDEYVSDNGNNWDANWDPIWYLNTSINTEGWIAEMRIPLSQLRFADKPEHTWGIQFTRRFFRNEERSNWQYISPDAGAWVHLFGQLKGIKGIKPQKQLEIQPYVLAKTERFEKEEGNPFRTGKSSAIDVGLDAKIGITSDITLDLSVNPDFGQVEADPSQVNLSAFRLFFPEQRPFFIEGNNTLNFPIVDFNSNNLFYSRRIGRNPQGSIDTDKSGEDDVDEFVKTKTNSTILGAAKLTGKNKKGFSWGILESVTGLEKATVDSLGSKKRYVIEPVTNYFVARAQQDINKGNTVVGAMFTATNRNTNDPLLDWLHKDAYTGGVDFLHNWKERMYYISTRMVWSHVKGSNEAITISQEAPERYFQRPDNRRAEVDSTRRSLTGTGGTFIYGKRSGSLVFEFGFTYLSPELELNDIGFLTQTDRLTEWVWAQYRILKPFGAFRTMRYNFTQYVDWDFNGKKTIEGYELNSNMQFKNFWAFNTGITYETMSVSNADLRGGPRLLYPGNIGYWFYINSDNRKKLSFWINPQRRVGFDKHYASNTIDMEFTYRPVNALSIGLAPSFSRIKNELQYVATKSWNNENRYVVAQIDQTIARISLRMTYMITPNLSVQYWGQPFGTSGKYDRYKVIADADASAYENRFVPIKPSSINLLEDEYEIDENGDGSKDYNIEKPDFNFGQFRSNMVIRWEYIPGSTLFLVWTQEMNGSFYDRQGRLNDRYSFSFDERAHNIFLLKYTYRFVF